MSNCDLAKTILESGLEGAAIMLLCVLSFKIYKMKIKTKSQCCDGFEIETANNGENNL